ncbi:MAG: formate-dependent phosphoribosylglycinamide formyltransferase [Synechococcales cyanobacterium RM1_1_8]|nr:formate-dependent phosphoribosylglycinamide formyltransferase [Synechococcales cyanobacterium RM1_1_8]
MPSLTFPKKLMLLGSGELGKELAIAAQRLGQTVIAVDRYANAPAMQVADAWEVISMLDGEALARIVAQHQPDLIVPEVEAIRTEKLQEFERQGITVIPTAQATDLTMNRDRIRDLAHGELGLRTARYGYASSLAEYQALSAELGFPNVVKPVMSSSGKGQSVVRSPQEVKPAWDYAMAGSRGDAQRVIVEEFIDFELEITLLTIRQWQGPTLFCPAIGHRQERGDYQESWQPCGLSPAQEQQAQAMARQVTDALGGAGLFGVEFFITPDEVIFSELSPRPHDTGMVTLVSQNLNEFELHLRAILGLPIPAIEQLGPSASSVILSPGEIQAVGFTGLAEALTEPGVDLRLFGKPDARPYRRMGVALARGSSTNQARQKANRAAAQISVIKLIDSGVSLAPSPQPLSHKGERGSDPSPLLHPMEKGLGDRVGLS